MWDRENLMQSELAELNASAFRVPYGEDGEVRSVRLLYRGFCTMTDLHDAGNRQTLLLPQCRWRSLLSSTWALIP